MDQTKQLTPIDPESLAEARAAAPSETLLALVVDTFQALADPTRAKILYALLNKPLCVRDLAILAGISQSAASHQLRFLRSQHLVKTRRAGNIVYYSVSDPHLAVLFREAEYHADHVYRDLPDHPYRQP